MTTTAVDEMSSLDDEGRPGESAEPARRFGAGRAYALLLVITGALGILAAAVITLDKEELLTNPNYHPACSLNPVVSCTDVMKSWQAGVFGFPNPLAGLVTFGCVVGIGMGLLAGARYARWYWIGLNTGTLLGTAFCTWLMIQALYDINALCLWCCLTWAVTIAMFWYTTVHNIKHGILRVPAGVRSAVVEFHWVVPVLWYALIGLLILTNWWSFWTS
ncbi:vitamin K epoxide reductase family protein [Streptomyces sp. NPDC059740]|uniref:vitamin K epoxide reductase family protein n=1 Tax=Streptomyces sp. NPDC059740 TaxID=3346926 RepID=UPI0036618825